MLPQSAKAELILENIEAKSQSPEGITESDIEEMALGVNTREELEEILPHLRNESNECKKNIAISDSNIKDGQGAKKFWQSRQQAITSVIGKVLTRLSLGKVSSQGASASTRTTNTLDVNDDELLKKYDQMKAVLETQLPDYVKVSLSIDKTKLTAAIQKNPDILTESKGNIKWVQKISVTLK